MTEYTVSEIAKICGLTVVNVAYRLNKLGLKSPHDDSHLAAVRNYLDKPGKKPTLYQMVKQRYGEKADQRYQGYSYRWCKLRRPEISSLEELEDLWNKHVEERKAHAKEYKEYSKHINSSSRLTRKSSPKLRHMFDWYTFDPSGTWNDEVLTWYFWYLNSGHKSCMARRLAYLEVLKQHHILDQDEYFEFKESKTKLKMAFQ